MTSFFHIHPDDARWLRRWLRGNLICVLVCGILLGLLRMENGTPPTDLRADTDASGTPGASMASDHPVAWSTVAILPDGWRRTVHGWEHVSTWRMSPRVDIDPDAMPAERAPHWIQSTLTSLRAIPPLVFATLQIALIALIIQVLDRKKIAQHSARADI